MIMSGELYCWGRNDVYQLGLGDTTDRLVPTRVGTFSDWIQLTVGLEHGCALRSSGLLYCWGRNGDGELGTGDTTPRMQPTNISDVQWSSISASPGNDSATCAVQAMDGRVFCWGSGDGYQLGNGDVLQRTVPTPTLTMLGGRWSDVNLGEDFACALYSTGHLYCWGINTTGQLGTGDTTTRMVPTQIGTSTNWTYVRGGAAHTCGLQRGGLYCWGDQVNGQTGLGAFSATPQLDPADLVPSEAWFGLAVSGPSTCASTADQRLFCWGDNDSGQLGTGDIRERNTPTPIMTSDRFRALEVGGAHTCVQRTDGAFLCWGDNEFGELGRGDRVSSLVPVAVCAP